MSRFVVGTFVFLYGQPQGAGGFLACGTAHASYPDYFTVTSADMERDGWSFPVEGGVLFTPDFRHEPIGWYIMSPEVKYEVRAAMQGVVRLVRKTDLGKTVVVLHPNGLETCYSHNARNLVRVGDRVKAGDVIATVGRTGRATTEHCHFEVRVNGVPFNSDYIFDHGRHALRKDKLTFTRKSNGTISVRKI